MGFKISWIAFQGLSQFEVMARIQGVHTGMPDEARESPFSFAEIPQGWSILFTNDVGFVTRERLAAFSADCSLVACQIHEGIMISTAFGYRQGAEEWAVRHNSQNGIHDLQILGSPPDAFAAIRARLTAAQEEAGGESADVDYFFDVPVETAEAICSFRHDRWRFSWGEPAFSVVELQRAPAGSE